MNVTNEQITNGQVSKLLHLRHVPRWVVIPTIAKQNVAEHVFNSMVIGKWLMHRVLFGAFITKHLEHELINAILLHDMDEAISGDIPGPYKHQLQREPHTSFIEVITKVADVLERIIFLTHESDNLGNRGVRATTNHAWSRLAHWWQIVVDNPWEYEYKMSTQLEVHSALIAYLQDTVWPDGFGAYPINTNIKEIL